MLKIYQDILGLQFEEVHGDIEETQVSFIVKFFFYYQLVFETCYIWHKDVKLYSVKDTDTTHLLGYFYLDLYPRDGKYPLQIKTMLKKKRIRNSLIQ